MGIQISGKLHVIFDAKQISERFRKREFVLELCENPRYPQFVQFQLTGDRCENIDGFSVGDEVRVDFSLRGRQWDSPQGETKFFNSLDVWSIDRVADSVQTAGFDPARGPVSEEPPLPESPPPGFEDIPF